MEAGRGGGSLSGFVVQEPFQHAQQQTVDKHLQRRQGVMLADAGGREAETLC